MCEENIHKVMRLYDKLGIIINSSLKLFLHKELES